MKEGERSERGRRKERKNSKRGKKKEGNKKKRRGDAKREGKLEKQEEDSRGEERRKRKDINLSVIMYQSSSYRTRCVCREGYLQIFRNVLSLISICDVKFNEFGETCELIYGKLIGYLIYGKYIST